MLNRDDLHDYQKTGIDFILSRSSCALWVEMGLGKTVMTLTALSDLLDDFKAFNILIIAPLRVANSVWGTEIENWSHLSHLTYSICTGKAIDRINGIESNTTIKIINRDNVVWLTRYFKEKKVKWPFDVVVRDEASSFKNHSAKKFKALKYNLSNIDRVIELTGTPAPNGYMDIWAQMYLLDRGKTFPKNISRYRGSFFTQSRSGFKYIVSDLGRSAIDKLCKPYTLSMKVSDHLDIPSRVDIHVVVKMSLSSKKKYKEFEKDFVLMLNDNEIVALTAGVLAGKLLQFANGALYLEDGSWIESHTEKLDALSDLIEDNKSENVLVGYNFKSDLVRLQKRFPDAVVLDKKNETIERWNRGEIKMLLAHPASAGHGLNLQKGGSVLVWFGLNWSLELYQQFNARLHISKLPIRQRTLIR